MRGDDGRSLTRLSAALTICQVRAVVKITTTNHPPINASLLTGQFSQAPSSLLINDSSRFSQGSVSPAKPIYAAAMSRVVLIEDDVEIRRLVAEALSEQGHDVESAVTAMDGLQLAIKRDPDLVVMDLGLPDLDGIELLRMIRSISEVPIIVITARGEDDMVVKTLDAGADDYLTKPFSLTQLEARVRAVLRRGSMATTEGPIRVGDLTVDAASREATIDGNRLDLSPKEFDLLHVLAARSGEVVSKRELMAEVWREPYGGSERTVDVHLSWLRSKLGEKAQEPRYLHTIHGVGVKLVDPTV